jgi:septal ring factor EnvC (AmiA/AmiB activator)
VTLKDQLSEATSRIQSLEAEIAESSEAFNDLAAEHKADAEAKNTKISELTTANEALVADGLIRAAKISDLTVRAEKAEGQVVTLEGEAKTADERAREIAARNGANLPKKDPKVIETVPGDKVMSRSEWRNLKAGAQMAFFKNGGTLTD